jgi:von Willebrand factor type D domain
MKFALSFTLLAMSTFVGLVASQEECRDAWAYDDGKDLCAEDYGALEWGWTNGRYGTSGCSVCDCPDCPTSAPTPNQAPTPMTPAPTPERLPLPQMCVGFAAAWSGDPHFTTFDKVKYDCQGAGEFHLLKSLTSGFEIQGRFEAMTSTSRPTITKSIVFKTGDGEPKIQVSTPKAPDNAGICMPTVYVEGIETDVLTNLVGDGSLQVARHVIKGAVNYVFYFHNSGFQLSTTSKKTSKGGCVLATRVCLPYDWPRAKETLVGLLGSPDKNANNDWMDRNNKAVAIPATKKGRVGVDAYNYCVKNWCIESEQESMFHYLSGESYAGFKKCDLGPDTTTSTCIDNPSEALAKVCGPDNMECLVDGCVGGEEEAKAWLDTQAEEIETDCGREVFLENFDSSFGAQWGDLHQGKPAQ